MLKPRNRIQVKINKKIFFGDYFNEFWNKTKYKSIYQVDLDKDKLIEECVDILKKNFNIEYPQVTCTRSIININFDGVDSINYSSTSYLLDFKRILPDIVTYLVNETNLNRKTIVQILYESDTLSLFEKNPQEYMIELSKIINHVKEFLSADNIKYVQLEDYYSERLFLNDEQFWNMGNNIIKTEKSIYEYIKCNSKLEKMFAEKLEKDVYVKLFFKFPFWYKITTPLGNYTPNWAIIFEKEGKTEYFVVETSRTSNISLFKPKDQGKIKCGKKHFEALGSNIHFCVVSSFEDFKIIINQFLI